MASKYHFYKLRPLRSSKIILIGAATILIVIITGLLVARAVYLNQLKPVNSSQPSIFVKIANGSSADQIAEVLAQQNLVKSAWALQLYLRMQGLRDKLQAGTYELSPSFGTVKIVEYL